MPQPMKPYVAKIDVKPFGDRFQVVAEDGIHSAVLIMRREKVVELRDRCNAVLKEGRAVKARLRRGDA